MIINGEGYYQGKAKQIIHKGEVIKCLPNVEHWRGATPKTGVTHVVSSPTHKSKIIWLNKLTEEEYNSIPINTTAIKSNNTEQEIIHLSKTKWRWMSDRNVDSLKMLYSEKAVFVHMCATFSKEQ